MADKNDDHSTDGDDSDEDYVPTGDKEVLSEEDSDDNVDDDDGPSKKKRKSCNDDVEKDQPSTSKVVKNPEEFEKNIDKLWEEMKEKKEDDKNDKEIVEKEEKETKIIKETYEFAGEKVEVVKEVEIKKNVPINPGAMKRGPQQQKGGFSMLSNLGKSKKMSTLEKSKHDWSSFKKDNNLDEEIKTFNSGKKGYLDKVDFLQRCDERQFEKEKELRNKNRGRRN